MGLIPLTAKAKGLNPV